MKKFPILIFTLVFIFSGCSDKTENGSAASVSMAESSSQSESLTESSGYENPYTSCVPEWSVSSPDPDPSYVHSTDTSSNISAHSETYQSAAEGITSSSLPESNSH